MRKLQQQIKTITIVLAICLILGCVDNRNPRYNKTYWKTETTQPQINYAYRDMLRNNPVSTTIYHRLIPRTKNITIASWNLQRYGPAKGRNSTLVNYYVSKIENYDITVLLEITDQDGDAIRALTDRLQDRIVFISDPVGTPGYKEEYVVFYRNVTLIKSSMIDSKNIARSPLLMRFASGNWTFNLIIAHITPEKVSKELADLENETHNSTSDIIIIGDLNAGCSYYPKIKNFVNWTWGIPSTEDTTSGNTTCAYDRIVMNAPAADNFIKYGIMRDVTTQTDHYLIYGVFNTSKQ